MFIQIKIVIHMIGIHKGPAGIKKLNIMPINPEIILIILSQIMSLIKKENAAKRNENDRKYQHNALNIS